MLKALATAAALVVALLVSAAPASARAEARCDGQLATIVGTNGSDTLRGTPRRDVIVAKGGDDVVIAGKGHDLVCGGSGVDILRGGRGRDTLLDRVSSVAAGSRAVLAEEGVTQYGGAGNDTLVGTGGSDYLSGGGGSDELRAGNGGTDELLGGDGDDTLYADAAAYAVLDFGEGTDVWGDERAGTANVETYGGPWEILPFNLSPDKPLSAGIRVGDVDEAVDPFSGATIQRPTDGHSRVQVYSVLVSVLETVESTEEGLAFHEYRVLAGVAGYGGAQATVYDAEPSATVTATTHAGHAFTAWSDGPCDGSTDASCSFDPNVAHTGLWRALYA